MFERWWDLDLGQRRLLAAVGAVVVVLAVVTGAVVLSHSGGDHVALTTDQSSTTTSRATTSSSSSTTSVSVAAVAATSTSAAGGTSTTSKASATSSTVKGKSKGGTVTSTTRAPVTTKGTTATTQPATTTTEAVGPCNPGGGNGDANQIANLFCSYRKSDGLATMTRNSSLDQLAQQWAEKMANDAAMSHNPDYKSGVLAGCGRCNGWSENVAYDTNATNAWNGWLRSCGHERNIAYASAGEYGVGAASGGGQLWFVQDFGYYDGSPTPCPPG